MWDAVGSAGWEVEEASTAKVTSEMTLGQAKENRGTPLWWAPVMRAAGEPVLWHPPQRTVPSGFQVDSTDSRWTPDRLPVAPPWPPSGLPVASQRPPSGLLVDSIASHN